MSFNRKSEKYEKMKRIVALIIFGITVLLLISLVSCSTTKVHRAAVEMPQAAAKHETPSLLADTHKAAGVECNDCHREKPPANDVPDSVCLGCHENYKEVAASYIDPHNAHIEYSSCSDCHHSHRASENQCLSCHSFNIRTP